MIVRLDALLVDQLESDGDLLGVHCARVGDVEGLKHFLDEGGNVNATDQSGTSMLHYAASHGHQACLNLLLKHQSDPNIKNRYC
jgi:ankyrin repeat protein